MIVTIVEDRYLTQLAPHRGTVAPAAQTHKFKTHVGACACVMALVIRAYVGADPACADCRASARAPTTHSSQVYPLTVSIYLNFYYVYYRV